VRAWHPLWVGWALRRRAAARRRNNCLWPACAALTAPPPTALAAAGGRSQLERCSKKPSTTTVEELARLAVDDHKVVRPQWQRGYIGKVTGPPDAGAPLL
jgi:hypothetical protein